MIKSIEYSNVKIFFFMPCASYTEEICVAEHASILLLYEADKFKTIFM